MPKRHADRIVSRTEESAATGAHYAHQVLVASLIGAILVLIAIAMVSFH
jgi:hypothetical protein